MILLLLLICLLRAAPSKDFMGGFETGIFLSQEADRLNDYSCPLPTIEIGVKNKLQGVLNPMKLMASMRQDKYV